MPIHVRTWDGQNNSTWLRTKKGEYETWGITNLAIENYNPGTYGLDIARVSSGTNFDLTHSGTWYLNKNKLPASSGIN